MEIEMEVEMEIERWEYGHFPEELWCSIFIFPFHMSDSSDKSKKNNGYCLSLPWPIDFKGKRPKIFLAM